MYRILVVFAFLSIAFFSCRPKDADEPVVKTDTISTRSVLLDKEPVNAEGERMIMPRDYSIDTTNSYSTFFMDSMSLVQYFEAAAVPDSIRRRMTSFYNVRNYQFAWFSRDGVQEDTRGFWNLYSYYNTYEKTRITRDSALTKVMGRILPDPDFASDSLYGPANPKVLNTELALTHQYILYILKNFQEGYLHKSEMEYFIPSKKKDVIAIADSLVELEKSEGVNPVNKAYAALTGHLTKLLEIRNSGGWPVVPASVLSGDSAARKTLVQVLTSMGDYPSDPAAVNDSSYRTAIKSVQERFGYKPTGKLTAQQLKDINVPVEYRIRQVVANLNRTKWMINEPGGQFISVNIPEFMLRVYEKNKEVMNMRVVVGREANSTVNFTGNLNQVVFSPYWNVPLSITKKEVLPGYRRRGQAYLNRQNMEIYGSWGNGIPRFRQRPGGGNSLGLVKFLFPNSYDIYFHDSPQKSLFNLDKRAYSHGCIRLQRPKDFAQYLLQYDTAYKEEVIDSLMHMRTEKTVRLKKAIPVMISYYTAWVDEAGRLHFADDIYKKDKVLGRKLFSGQLPEPKPVVIKDTVAPQRPVVQQIPEPARIDTAVKRADTAEIKPVPAPDTTRRQGI